MITDTYKHLRRFSGIIILLSLIITSLALPQKVHAGGGITLTVDTTADNATLTACTSAPGDCSLRGAISHVNADTTGSPPMYEILLGATTYTLTGAADEDNNATGDLDTKPQNWLYITGVNATDTRINGNHLDRVIDHWGPSQLTLTNLTIENGQVATGKDGGGGIRNINGGNLWLTGVTVDSNTVSGTDGTQDMGGGIHNTDKTLTLEHSAITNNQALVSGGLELDNTDLWMDESTVADNHAIGGGAAGGIGTSNGGTFTILRSRILNNSAYKAGGFYNNGLGDLTLIDTLIAGNTADGTAGGGMVLYGTAALDRVTISGNSVPPGSNGGGLYVEGSVTLTNVTLTDNTAYWGGGIYIGRYATVTFEHVTDANNNTHPSGEGSAVYMDDEGTGTGGTFIFRNSIFSSFDPDTNTCNNAPLPATFTVTDNGFNLFDQTLNCYTHVFSDLTEAYPALGALGYYGGYTPTLPLYSFSDAIDVASPGDPAFDQRNHSRKDGDGDGLVAADIGAFEYESALLYIPMVIKP